MGSRTLQHGEAVGDSRHGNGMHIQSKTVLREVQNGTQGTASPRQLKKEGNSQLAAQDVAELKDYVGIPLSPRDSVSFAPSLTWC
jgi:hypothetical protein